MLRTLKYFLSRVYTLLSIGLFIFTYTALKVGAIYYPTDNITNPSCAPGDSGCYVSLLPDQTSNSGSLLFTNGTNPSWTSSSALSWDSVNGRLGVGTSSPSQKLQIGDGTGNNFLSVVNSATTIYLGQSGNTRFGYAGGTIGLLLQSATDVAMGIGTYGGDAPLVFGTNNIERMRIAGTTGNIGIGTTTPLSKLHISSSPAASANYGTLSLGGGAFDGTTSGYFGTASSSNTNGTSLAINEASGYTGDLINLQVAGVSKLKLASTGNLTVDSGAVNNTLTLSTSGVGTIQSNFYNSNANTVSGTSVFYMPVNTYRGGSLSTLPIAALQAVYKGDGTTGSVGRLGQWLLRTGGGGAGNFTTLIVGPENFMAMPSANSKFGINYTGTDIDNNTIPASFAVKGYGTTSATFTAQFHNSTGTSNSLVVRDDGNVGIGTSTPNQQLEITKNFRMPSTTFAAQYGVIYKDGNRFIHDFNYGNNGTVITTGENVFIGKGAGNFTMGSTATDASHSSYNVAIGSLALDSNTTGFANSVIGFNALGANTTGNYNVAFGFSALSSNTTGQYNIAIGNQVLGTNTIGINNVAMGGLGLNLSGSNNVSMGIGALDSNTTGGQNTAIGFQTLLYNTTGSNNTGIGRFAGTYIVDGSTANQTGSYSTFVGFNAKALANGQTNQNVFGYDAIGNGSNTFTFGNSNVIGHYFPAGNVGIGTTNAYGKLNTVISTTYASGANFTTSDWVTSTTGSGLSIRAGAATGNTYSSIQALTTGAAATGILSLNPVGGNVGIGTTSPSTKLYILGDTDAGANITIQRTGVTGTMVIGYEYLGTISSNPLRFFSDSTEKMRITSAGLVGIGTTAPAFPLDVNTTVSSNQTYGYLNPSGLVGTSSGSSSYSIRATGRVLASEFNAVSDSRLKDVQFDIDPSIALNMITGLRPVSFTWKNNPTGQPVLGLLAQEVEQVIPNAVSQITTDAFIDQRELSYNQLTAVSIGAIKELNIKINQLSSLDSEISGSFAYLAKELLGDINNKIDTIFAKKVRTEELCIKDTCVTEDQLKALLNNAQINQTPQPQTQTEPEPEPQPEPQAPDPVIPLADTPPDNTQNNSIPQ